MKKTIFYSVLCFLLFSWEFYTQKKPELFMIFPPVSQIVNCFLHSSNVLLVQTFVSIQSILGSFLLAFSLAFLLAWIMSSLKKMPSFLQNSLVILQSIPSFAVVPLIVIWFGWGKQAIIIPTAFMIFFPLTLTIFHGFQSVPAELLDYFHINQASTRQIFYKLRLPYSIPDIFSGLKIAASTAGIGVLSGEWIAGHGGLGILILESRRNYELPMMFSSLIMLSIMCICFYRLISFLEKTCFHKYVPGSRKHEKKKFPVFLSLFILTGLFLSLFSLKKHHYQFEKISHATYCTDYPKVVLCLDWTPNPNHIPLYVALEKGFFKKHNLNIVLKPSYGDTGLQVTYLVNNKVDLILYNSYGIVKANLKGLPLQFVSALTKHSLGGFMYRDSDNIKTLSDLNNKTIGFCLGNSNDTSFFDHIFSRHNIKPKEIVNVSSDLIYPMLTKKIDVLYGGFWNIEGSLLESFNLKTNIFLPDEYGMNNALDLVVCTSRNSPCSSRDFIEKFRTAVKESIEFCQQFVLESFDIYTKYCPNKGIPCLNWEKLAWNKTVKILDIEQQVISGNTIHHITNWLLTNTHKNSVIHDNFDITLVSPY